MKPLVCLLAAICVFAMLSVPASACPANIQAFSACQQAYTAPAAFVAPQAYVAQQVIAQPVVAYNVVPQLVQTQAVAYSGCQQNVSYGSQAIVGGYSQAVVVNQRPARVVVRRPPRVVVRGGARRGNSAAVIVGGY